MATFQPRQRRLKIRTRQFHFVAYEATPGNVKRKEEPVPAMWYLMVEGRRCPVMPFEVAQPEEEVELALTEWVTDNALAPAGPEPRLVEPVVELWEE
jgi:hypothetical protein